MERSQRKSEILDASMKIACKYGLPAFTTKKVADHIGISESLIYKYFFSKDNLLYACYEVTHKNIAGLMSRIASIPKVMEISDIDFIRQMWVSYFEFLVKENYRTVFYFAYRDSKYIKKIKEHDDEVANTYFSDFVSVINWFDTKYDFSGHIDRDILWTYILDTTGLFAKRTISGELSMSKENTESIWALIFKGIEGILKT